MKQMLFTISLTLLFTQLYSQDFTSTFDRFNGAFVPERVHLHLDKSTYAAGDTIWFKAYLMAGIAPAEKSMTLYVDWTDKKGQLIERTMLPLAAGVTYGQVALPADLASDFVHARAYTRWMLNFDSSFLFNKDIRILSAAAPAVAKEDLQISMTLFPESGNLVAGLSNRIAFKATDKYGRPVKAAGNIFKNGVKDQEIKTRHDGMGSFFMVPAKDAKYSLTWKDSYGTTHTTDFPQVQATGLILQVSESNSRKVFSVMATDPAVKNVHIIGTMYQQQVFSITRPLKDGLAQGLIPTESLPSGILTITVLDENFHPLAERITFINNREYVFATEMNVEHWGLNKRARNEIEISVPADISANLSVSVTDNSIDYDTSNSIISDLLLSSELKGKIYNPAFYFSGNADSTDPLLDLVMLTNGWRRISWTDLASGKLPELKYGADTSYQTISGKVLGATATQLQNAGDIILIVNQKDKNEFMSAPIDRNGNFQVNDFMLFDTAMVYYQPPKNKQLRNVTVQFLEDQLPVQSYTLAGLSSFVANPDTTGLSRHFMVSEQMQAETKFFEGKVLEGVTITARKKNPEEKLDETYASGLFSGGNGRGFDLRNEPAVGAYQNIFQFLQGRVAGISVTMGQPPSVSWRGGPPALFLNEMPVDAEMLATIPPSDIAYVKVMNPPFMGAAGGGGNGAIAIYTRKGEDVQLAPGKGLSKNTLTGYSLIRQFYSPDYERMQVDRKDLRTTLYWAPEVILNPAQRTVTLKFFNNDITQAFRVVIEGMTPDGKMTRLIKIME